MWTIDQPWAEPTLPLQGDAAALPPVRRVGGRYRLEGLLGAGGMALVYAATDEQTGRPVALKVLRRAARNHVARLEAEAAAMHMAQHPHVARLLEVGVEGGMPYLVMERASGCLAGLLQTSGPLPLEVLVPWALQILCGLSAVHAQGIVHRDLKPGNLLLAADGRVVVSDFGIARVPGFSLDMPQSAVGSPSYMAPEQRQGQRVGPQADLYALGATLFVLATGLRASELTRTEVPDSHWQALLGPLWPILARAMQPDPAHRYPTARAMAVDLVPLLPDTAWTDQPHLACWLDGQRPTPLSRAA